MATHLQRLVIVFVFLFQLVRVSGLPAFELAVKDACIATGHNARLGNNRPVFRNHLHQATHRVKPFPAAKLAGALS